MSDNRVDSMYDSLIKEVLKWFIFIPKKDRILIENIIFDKSKPLDDHIDNVTVKINIYITYSAFLSKIYNIKSIFKNTIKISLKKLINYQEMYDIVERHHVVFYNLYNNVDLFKVLTEHMFSMITIERVMRAYPNLLDTILDSYNETFTIPDIKENSSVYKFVTQHTKYIDKRSKNEYEVHSINTFIYYIFIFSEKKSIIERHKDNHNKISSIGLNYICSYKNIKHMLSYYKKFTKTASQINIEYAHYNENAKTIIILKMLELAAIDYVDIIYNNTCLNNDKKIRKNIIKDTLL